MNYNRVYTNFVITLKILLKILFSFLFKQLVRTEYKNVAHLPRGFPYYLDITTAFLDNPFMHFIHLPPRTR